MTRTILKPLAALLASAALAAPAFAASWDMPTPYGDTVFHTKNITQFAEDVAEATEGGLEITVHSAGSLFAHPEIKDAVRRGLAPIGETLMSRLANEDPIFEIDSIPFLAKHGFRPTYFTPLDTLVDFAHYYVEEARKHGHDFAFGERQNIARWIQLGDTEAEWHEKIRRYDAEMYTQHYATFFPNLPEFDNEADTGKAMIASGIFTGGNGEQLKETWRNIYAALPTEYITLVCHYAHLPREILLDQLGTFMTEILPELDAPYEINEAA